MPLPSSSPRTTPLWTKASVLIIPPHTLRCTQLSWQHRLSHASPNATQPSSYPPITYITPFCPYTNINTSHRLPFLPQCYKFSYIYTWTSTLHFYIYLPIYLNFLLTARAQTRTFFLVTGQVPSRRTTSLTNFRSWHPSLTSPHPLTTQRCLPFACGKWSMTHTQSPANGCTILSFPYPCPWSHLPSWQEHCLWNRGTRPHWCYRCSSNTVSPGTSPTLTDPELGTTQPVSVFLLMRPLMRHGTVRPRHHLG